MLVYAQKITHTLATFLRVMAGFDFQSPLNFIMLHEDFHNFYKMFYHTQLLAKYSVNIVTDSIFSIMHLRNPKDLSLQEQAKVDSLKKQEVASAMEKGIEAEIENAIKMLTQYSGLVEHDQINC